jgi:uncharacterized protein YjbI with pentapeptide repeats
LHADAEPYAPDLQKILFRSDDNQTIDLGGYDFSRASLAGSLLIDADLTGANLAGTNLTGAVLTGTNLSAVSSFDSSIWTGADWWNASRISTELCAYLWSKAPPPSASFETASHVCPR